jgi:Alw26I/Eco31I/Esp3I family type II restriction endonuclease
MATSEPNVDKLCDDFTTAKIEAETVKEENASRKAYEASIINHPNYEFLPKEQKQNWVCVSKKGQNSRKPYWDTKQKQLIDSGQIPNESIPVNVARFIHPTKKHVCGKCGMACSIYYEYPTANTWKWLKKTFDYDKDDDTKNLTIFEIYAKIITSTKKGHFEKYFGMVMADLETQCKSDKYSGSKLSPGVMSNAPDRLDGFHCYNSLCGCRPQHDKGRSTENMKSYTRDRRAYELLSDGKCLVANCLMGKLNTVTSICFICGKSNLMTADHIGPISLGFIHDPVNFQACCKMCNSKKNNRITEEDLAKIKSIEQKDICIVSWWAKDAWENNKHKSITTLKDNLNKNTKKFLSVIVWIKTNKLDVLESFITEIYMDHDKSYNISNVEVTSSGDIKFHSSESVTGKKTKDTQKERTKQILLELDLKKNRNMKIDLSEKETAYLSDITLANFKNKICKVLVGL